MAAESAKKDNNYVSTLIGVDMTTGLLPTRVFVDESTHRLLVSAVITGGGSSGTQYAELATTSPGTGTLALGRYNATPPSLTDLQMESLQLDSAGALKVTGSLSVGGTTDNSAYTAGTSTGTPAMGFYHSTVDTITDGRAATVALTSKRAQHVTLHTAAGVEITNTSSALDINIKSGNLTTLPVTNAGTFAVQEATLDAALISQEANTSGVKGITAFGAVTTNAPSYTNAKSDALSLDTSGLLRVSLKDTPANTNKLLVTPDSVALPANQSVNVSQINGVTPLMGAGNTGTGSARVTIASDQAVIPISDNSGSLTVDNGGTFAVQATVAAAATNIAKAEDVASANADVGVPAMAIQLATPTDLAGTDADYAMLQMAGGRLWVDASGKTLTVGSHAVTNTGTFATQSAITAASGSFSSGALASGSVASGAIASGAVASGAFASGSIVAGAIAAGATSFVKLEDVASADADAGVPAMAIQRATPVDTGGTDGDYVMHQMSAGRLWTASNIDKINAVTPLMGNGVTGTGSLRVTVASDNTAFSVNSTLQTQTDTVMVGGVNIKEINAVTPLMGNGVTGTGSQRVTIASDNTAFSVNANAGTNLNTSALALESGGNLATLAAAVHVEDVASANADKGIPAMGIRDDTLNATSGTEGDYEFLHTTAEGGLWVTAIPSTTGGWTPAFNAAVTTTVKTVKASAGTLGGWFIYNPNSSVAYVQIFDISGAVTLGTSVPVLSLGIPATAGANVESPNGIQFANAIKFACTTTSTGLTAPSTGLETNFWFK